MDPHEIIRRQRAFFQTGATRSPNARLDALAALDRAVRAAEGALTGALRDDLGKPAAEAYTSEIGFVLSEIAFARRHLRRWMAPAAVGSPLLLRPASATVVPEPRGVALIISPWNYPLQLAVSPLAAALAAGNTAVVKPSELAPRTAAVLDDLVRGAFPPERACVVTGGPDTATALLRERFDQIFFTGGGAVGRQVLQAAAATLTPCTLELGGKSPCFVCADARLDVAARRIAWGKFLNAGQTCVAPDYVLADRRIAAPLLDELARAIERFYGSDPRQSPDYGRIVSPRHIDRLQGLLAGARVACGGVCDREARYFAPTVLTDVTPAAPAMRDEIFGPILPVIPYDSLGEALDTLRDRPVPLALYLFSGSRATQDRILSQVRSGGVCVNDTLLHLLNPRLPFGGLGESGMGACRGRAGFDTFSHRRSVLRRGTRRDPSYRFPPRRLPLRWLKRLLPLLMR